MKAEGVEYEVGAEEEGEEALMEGGLGVPRFRAERNPRQRQGKTRRETAQTWTGKSVCMNSCQY